MASLVMIPSSSLPSSAYYSAGATTLPSPSPSPSFRRSPLRPQSPSSSWSPRISPLAQQQMMTASTAAAHSFVSPPASSPSPGAAVAVVAASPLLLQAATPAYSLAGSSGGGVLSRGVSGLSTAPAAPLPLLASSALPARQTIMVNEAGQAFLLSPVSSFIAAPQPQPLLAQYAGQLQQQQQQSLAFVSLQQQRQQPQQQQTMWLTAGGGGVSGGSVELLSPSLPLLQSALSPALSLNGAMFVSQGGPMLSLLSDCSRPPQALPAGLQQQQSQQLAVPATTLAGQQAPYAIVSTAPLPPPAHCVSTTSVVSPCASCPAAAGSCPAPFSRSCGQQPSSPALPVLSAFHTPTKRAATAAKTLAVAHPACVSPLCPTRAVAQSTLASPSAGCSGGELQYSPARRCSSSSTASSASSCASFHRLSMEEPEVAETLSSSSVLSSASYPNSRAGGGSDVVQQQQQPQQQQQRIDGMSSSRLLTHISKKPTFVLPFTLHRSQLPGHFDAASTAASACAPPLPPSLPASSSSSSASASPFSSHSQSQSVAASAASSPSCSSLSSDSLTVSIRVMGGPSLSELFFVAADISQLIHSRKSNIAKAVSVFSDSERARCSVVCPRSNRTQSTHILTVLTMAGVRRLLSSSRAAIALPFLAWLTEQAEKAVKDAEKAAAAGGGGTTAGGKRRAAAAAAAAAASRGEIRQAEHGAEDGDMEEDRRKRGRLD